jgi:hypothetical protein
MKAADDSFDRQRLLEVCAMNKSDFAAYLRQSSSSPRLQRKSPRVSAATANGVDSTGNAMKVSMDETEVLHSASLGLVPKRAASTISSISSASTSTDSSVSASTRSVSTGDFNVSISADLFLTEEMGEMGEIANRGEGVKSQVGEGLSWDLSVSAHTSSSDDLFRALVIDDWLADSARSVATATAGVTAGAGTNAGSYALTSALSGTAGVTSGTDLTAVAGAGFTDAGFPRKFRHTPLPVVAKENQPTVTVTGAGTIACTSSAASASGPNVLAAASASNETDSKSKLGLEPAAFMSPQAIGHLPHLSQLTAGGSAHVHAHKAVDHRDRDRDRKRSRHMSSSPRDSLLSCGGCGGGGGGRGGNGKR